MVREEVDKKVCGCCELRLGCIFAASCRVFITIASTVVLFGTLFNTDLQRFVLEFISDSTLNCFIVVSIPTCIITIRWSYWFIRGATASTVNSTLIRRMHHYILLQFVTAFVLVICFNMMLFFLAMVEIYLMYYTAILIKQRKLLLCESSLNDAETPPPQYDSCVNKTQLPTSTVHLENDLPFTESQGPNVVGPDTNSSNAAVDTNPSVEARKEQNILNSDGKESVESSVQNDATIREGNSITTTESEPKEKLGFEENVGGEHVSVVSEKNSDSNVVQPTDNVGAGSDENQIDHFETNPKIRKIINVMKQIKLDDITVCEMARSHWNALLKVEEKVQYTLVEVFIEMQGIPERNAQKDAGIDEYSSSSGSPITDDDLFVAMLAPLRNASGQIIRVNLSAIQYIMKLKDVVRQFESLEIPSLDGPSDWARLIKARLGREENIIIKAENSQLQ